MSAVEVIAAALAAGAGAGLTDATSAAVRDAYARLKELLKRRVGDDGVLEANETEPGFWQAQLGDALTASGAADDERILAAARQLLALADPASAAKYRVDVREAKGVQVGDRNIQTNTFN
ncbi:hypothetical protein ACQP2X_27355 [Actinoplanes sp. CA-131856]